MTRREGTVLVVEDDAAVGKVTVALLSQAGYEAVHVPSGEEALERLAARPFDAVVSDLRMPGMDGLALLGHVGHRFPGVPFVLVTAHGSVPLAVEAMRNGAADFLVKPLDREALLFVVGKALAGSRPSEDAKADEASGGSGPVVASRAMQGLYATARKVAAGTATVLIRGETGTGKELVARAIHEGSRRRDGPFVRVHCAALPDSLLESELFGYEKGAFTGATGAKPGRVELADQGTLFLDEIGDTTPALQVKLLRVLQERELERLGGTATRKVDVRFVAATHRDLEAMVAKGEFREDFFYRLNVVPLLLPPLRERPEDVEALARHFVQRFGASNGRPAASFDASALAAFRAHAWPGNVRELQNLAERLVVLADEDVIRGADVERELGKGPKGAHTPAGSQAPPPVGALAPVDPADPTLDATRREAEKDAIVQALSRAKGNRTLAARLLGVSRRTLYNKLREHSLA